MTFIAEEASHLQLDATRHFELEDVNNASLKATQAYALWQHSGNAIGMSEAARIVIQCLIFANKSTEAAQMASEELVKFKKLGDEHAEAVMLLCLGESYCLLQCDDALQYSRQARHAFRILKVIMMEGKCLLAIARAQLAMHDVASALEAFREALQLFRSCGDSRYQGLVYHGIAIAEARGANFDSAIAASKEALTLFHRNANVRDEFLELQVLATLHLEAGRINLALGFAEEAFAFAQKEDGVVCWESSALGLLGKVLLESGNSSSVLRIALEAVKRYRHIDEKDAELNALMLLAEAYLNQDSLHSALQTAEEALIVSKELADVVRHKKMLMLISQIYLKQQNWEEALRSADKALKFSSHPERGERILALDCIARAHLLKPGGSLEQASRILQQVAADFRDVKDENGEALSLLVATSLHTESRRYQEALVLGKRAIAAFQNSGDKHGEASVLQLCAVACHQAGQVDDAIQSANKAIKLGEPIGDLKGETSMCLLLAQVHLEKLGIIADEPLSPSFKQILSDAAEAAKKAERLARKINESNLLIAALCFLSQVQLLSLQSEDAVSTANSALSLSRKCHDRHGEANALVHAAAAYIALGKLEVARQSAGKALLLFRELEDALGQGRAEAAIDAIENPTEALYTTSHVSQRRPMKMTLKQKGADGASIKQKVRTIVSEIVGIDDLVDDSPLMQSGLTSQSAVLLRNALTKVFPGTSLPFTLVFDFPTVTAMSDFFVEQASTEMIEVPYEGEDEEIEDVHRAGGQDILQIKKKVQSVVSEILGMDDLEDDTPLMQSGLTSNSAVLLRNSLMKAIPGTSGLPFTLMFDYPSIAALVELFIKKGSPQVSSLASKSKMAAAAPPVAVMQSPEAATEAVRQKVRKVVGDIVGVDDLEDDTPLMQSGLTSQSAVLLRNSLSKDYTGLPHTLMFDFPSISDLSTYLTTRTAR